MMCFRAAERTVEYDGLRGGNFEGGGSAERHALRPSPPISTAHTSNAFLI